MDNNQENIVQNEEIRKSVEAEMIARNIEIEKGVQLALAIKNAEERKTAAENEFIIICNDKKRVLLETENLNKKLEETEGILKNKLSDIETADKRLKGIQDSIALEVENLNGVINKRVLVEKDFNDFKSLNDAKKNKISLEVSDLEKDLEEKKKNALKELADIEISKSNIVNQIKLSEESLNSLKKSQSELKGEIDKTNLVLSELLSKKNSLSKEVENINAVIDTKKKELSNIESNISDSEKMLDSKKIQLQHIESSIVIKNEEYKSLESKAFSILHKADMLANKEAFIKSQYERAGIKYE